MGEHDRSVLPDLAVELVLSSRDLVEARNAPGLAQLGLVVVGLVLEEQRDDPLCDQVAAMDPREAFGDDGANP